MIVVTGASGFIGSALVHDLAAAGVAVVGIDRRPPHAEVAAARHVLADLADPLAPALRRLLGAADAVVHLAARPGVRDTSPGIELARHRDNVVATRHVLAAAGGPVLTASSSSVYGGARDGRASREDDPRAPIGGYARSKARAEDACAAARAAGATVCVLRPFTVVGPGQRPDMAIDHWLRAALAGRPLDVLGDLARTRDVTDVRAVVAALHQLVAAAVAGRALPDVLNVGTGRSRSLGELITAVARVTGRQVDVRVTARHDDEPDHTRADTARCAAVLGWVPVTDLDDVVAAQLGHVGVAA